MREIAPGTRFIDLEHLGRRQVIGACLIESAGHRALVDPGPGSTLATLLEKLGHLGVTAGDLEAVMLTHIHLDHAGATGRLVALNPSIRVYVHERGAPHMAQPERLLQSAGRLYRGDMARLWGEFLAVPPANLRVVADGDEFRVGDRRLRVAATPGHASHHVCYLDAATQTAFTGDTGGVRLEGTDLVLPPTPPPDIHLARWRDSIETIRGESPARLVLTHFGVVTEVDAHLDALTSSLDRWSRRVRRLLEGDGDDTLAQATFVDEVEGTIRARIDTTAADALIQAVTPALCWLGLVRYWRKHGDATGN